MEVASLPILYNRFWFSHEPLCLYKSMPSYPGMGSLSEYSNFSLFRRLAFNGRQQGTGSATDGSSGQSPSGPWLEDQLQEIDFDTFPKARTPRFCIEYQVNDNSTSSKEITGSSSINQATSGQPQSPDASYYTQPYDENSSSNVCNLSSPTVHPTSPILQKSGSEGRQGLGSTSGFGSIQRGRTTLVVPESAEVERSIFPPYHTHRDRLRGC